MTASDETATGAAPGPDMSDPRPVSHSVPPAVPPRLSRWRRFDRQRAEGALRGRPVRALAEFGLLFLVTPLVLALALPPSAMWTLLAASTLVGIVLLWRTPGVTLRGLFLVNPVPNPLLFVAFVLGTAAISAAIVWSVRPSALFSFPSYRPEQWMMVMLLYPILSALPQELLFRALYFRRYGAYLPRGNAGIVLNGAVFSLAHLMYWNLPALVLTFVGGCVFAWTYERRGSFTSAVLLHALAGQILFTVGMGMYFYHGAVR